MSLKLPKRYRPTPNSMSGGQGTVHVYRDSLLDRDVAVKVLHNQNSHTLKQELRCLSEIPSRHVAEVYDLIDLGSGGLALIQEYVSGPHLEQYLDDPNRKPAAHTLWQIAKGVEDIHISKKIHRDLKPENLRLDGEGVLKILDFGLAMDTSSSLTMGARGSRHYAAPELYGIPPIILTQAADMYAVGVLAWYVANDKAIPQFLWDSRRNATIASRSIGTILTQVSPDLVTVLDNCVEIDRAKRPTATAVRQELQREVLRGTHRMHITYEGNQKILQKAGEQVTLRYGTLSTVVKYSGTDFYFESCTSDCYVNNMPIIAGSRVPGSCVVTLGSSGKRMFVAIDVSHPGITK